MLFLRRWIQNLLSLCVPDLTIQHAELKRRLANFKLWLKTPLKLFTLKPTLISSTEVSR